MHGSVRSRIGLLAALLAAVLLLPATTSAQETQATSPAAPGITDRLVSGLEVGFDVLVLRPLSAVQLLVGGGLFVPAAALSYFSEPDALQQTREVFIDLPAENLYRRRLGDL